MLKLIPREEAILRIGRDWDLLDPMYDYSGEKTCRYCGKTGLMWTNMNTKDKPEWRLMDKNAVVHSCPEYPTLSSEKTSI